MNVKISHVSTQNGSINAREIGEKFSEFTVSRVSENISDYIRTAQK